MTSRSGSAEYASAVEALRDKYAELLALRQERERAQAEGLDRFDPATSDRRRAAMRALAARFPGALRELDLLGAEQLAARLARCEAELARAASGRAAEDRLVACMVDYHRFMKQALRLKRRLARGGLSEEEHARLRARESLHHRLEPGWSEAQLDATLLRSLARPAGGRIQPLVLAAVAAKHRLEPAALERLLFGCGEA